MLFCILAVVSLLIFIIIIIIGVKCDVTDYESWQWGIAISMVCTILFATLSILGSTSKVDEIKYTELSIIAEYYDELPVYQKAISGGEILDWNNHLNDYNNIWFKFVIEDRSKYIITLKEE